MISSLLKGKDEMTKPKQATAVLQLQIAVAVEEDGDRFHAFCPALKGLHVDGTSKRETLENARTAIEVYLDSLALHGDPLPVGPYLKIKDTEEPLPNAQFHNLTIPWPSLATSGIS